MQSTRARLASTPYAVASAPCMSCVCTTRSHTELLPCSLCLLRLQSLFCKLVCSIPCYPLHAALIHLDPSAAGEAGPLGMIGQGGGGSGGSKNTQGLERRILRKRSPAITSLVEIIGTSGKIYQHLIDLCKVCGCVARGSSPALLQLDEQPHKRLAPGFAIAKSRSANGITVCKRSPAIS